MPNGEGQPFMKFDQEKNRLELIEPEFIEGVGKVLTYGAVKYEAWNWRKVNSQEDLDRIKGATLRHMMAYMRGEKTDPDTNLSHLYHMGCNLMFLDYFDRNPIGDNKPLILHNDELSPPLKMVDSLGISDTLKQGLEDYDYNLDWQISGFDHEGWAYVTNKFNGGTVICRTIDEFISGLEQLRAFPNLSQHKDREH